MTVDRARRLASLLKEIEDEIILFGKIHKEHKARVEKLRGEVRTLGFAILSGQEELPLEVHGAESPLSVIGPEIAERLNRINGEQAKED
jgi:aspartate aminotransferase-like enzyme